MTKRTLALAGSLALLTACKDSTGVPDLNNVSSGSIAGGLNAASAQLLVTGILNQDRIGAIGNYIVFGESMARDAYRLDNAEIRYITQTIGSVAPDAAAFTGGGVFIAYFITIRAANTLLSGLANATGLTASDKAGISGIAKTIKALDFYRALEYRDTLGLPIDVNRPIDAKPADFKCKPAVLAYVSALLDSAYTDLGAAGPSFAVALPSGFAGFDTPATFATFNRALKGKVEVYRGLAGGGATSFNAALAAFGQSYLNTAGDLQAGPKHVFSTASGEVANSLVDNALHLNPAVHDSILPGDTRVAKITTSSTTYKGSGAQSAIATNYNYTYSLGSSFLTRPIGILKNEELILLRAQAEIELGDLVSATNDVNAIRSAYGLPPTVLATKAMAISEVLYEKRYSLLFEGPQRLVDLRAYGRLNAANFKPELPGDLYTQILPIPNNEVNARGGTVVRTCP